MKKLILVGAAVAALAPASVASAVTVTDPTPNGAFTGTYTNSTGGTGTQTGYVQADQNGVVACNGQAHENSSGAGDFQGYIWVGPSNAASHPVGEAPGGAAGAGDNQDPTTDAGAPCPANNTG